MEKNVFLFLTQYFGTPILHICSLGNFYYNSQVWGDLFDLKRHLELIDI